MKKALAISLSVAMLLSIVMTVLALPTNDASMQSYVDVPEGYSFNKITNPEAGSGEPDGLNTNDETGFEANRYNSYAWAMEELGGKLYIGTNRNLYGSAIATISKQVAAMQGITYEEAMEKVVPLANMISANSIPDIREMEEEDWIPQILSLDPATGVTKVVFQPDMEGITPSTEVCSFRSVIKHDNKLYFGSLGATRLQIVCIDENDNAEVVYNASAKGSSLRACTTWDGTVVFGGLDNTLTPAEDSEYAGMKPIVIRAMNPEDNTDWSDIIADYRDFIPYADETVYQNAGGTVWDLVSYNGKLYVILAADNGFVMFSGVKATEEQIANGEANDYGYIWTPVIGEGGKYNPGMAETPAGMNPTGSGLLDSTATPFVYNGKLYLGTFDNSTAVIINTFMLLMQRVNNMESGPSLSTVYGALYNVATNPQELYCMDENENIVPVENLNDQLANTVDDYIWRMREHNGKLYLTTFDPSVLWNYLTSVDPAAIIDASTIDSALYIADATKGIKGDCKSSDIEIAARLIGIAGEYAQLVNAYLAEEITIEELAAGIEALQAELDALIVNIENEDLLALAEKLRALMNAADVQGLKMIIEINNLCNSVNKGFSIYVSEDGENFTEILDNGFEDEYNYGGRTLAVCGDNLYVGTANPFYGAQVWQISEADVPPTDQPTEPPTDQPTEPPTDQPTEPPTDQPTEPPTDQPMPMIGDVNGDGTVNTADAVAILRYAADMAELSNEQLIAADVNRDQTVNTADAVGILRYAAGLITEF